MAGRGGFHQSNMPLGQQSTRQSMYGNAPTMQRTGSQTYAVIASPHASPHPSNGSAVQHDPRGRSCGGGQSSFNPFAHDGQGQYQNPYDIHQVEPATPIMPSPSGGFHTMGGSNKRRGQGGGGASYEVTSTTHQEQSTLYGGPPPPTTGYYQPPSQPQYHQQGPYWEGNGNSFQTSQHQQSYQHTPATYSPMMQQPMPPWPSYDNNNNGDYAPRPSSQDMLKQSSGSPLSSYKHDGGHGHRPPSSSSRSTLGSAGALAMQSPGGLENEPHQGSYGHQYSQRTDNQQPPTTQATQRRPDIYLHDPSHMTPSPAKPSQPQQQQQWGGTGTHGHASTRISRPPGGHSNFVLG
ncbi:Aste57867_16209 [Aphanomyces stellatus]|uniref:Aste57867_16209 protein n=1 Tax=Aphanomyces stellatus TaxID=120398 RepID=A0A485L536_9STRA|nr:hypothetical protein As57867_016152 [Aphanomyces stellatus]VFT92987.1 Aste57867_16209 [Aphanomyces stellatus]